MATTVDYLTDQKSIDIYKWTIYQLLGVVVIHFNIKQGVLELQHFQNQFSETFTIPGINPPAAVQETIGSPQAVAETFI